VRVLQSIVHNGDSHTLSHVSLANQLALKYSHKTKKKKLVVRLPKRKISYRHPNRLHGDVLPFKSPVQEPLLLPVTYHVSNRLVIEKKSCREYSEVTRVVLANTRLACGVALPPAAPARARGCEASRPHDDPTNDRLQVVRIEP
jgi:hypothetical protein